MALSNSNGFQVTVNGTGPTPLYGPFNFEPFPIGNFVEDTGAGVDNWQTSTDASMSDPLVLREVENANPLVPGQKYLHTQTYNDITHLENNKRVELSHSAGYPDNGSGWVFEGPGPDYDNQGTAIPGYFWRAPESFWYGFLLRIDRDDDNLAASGFYAQWHNRTGSTIPGRSPLIGLAAQAPYSTPYSTPGLRFYFEATRESGPNFTGPLASGRHAGAITTDTFMPSAEAIGTVHAFIFHIYWDNRLLSEGGQGFCHCYVDDNPTPVYSHLGSNFQLESRSTGVDGHYFKWGLYKSAWKSGRGSPGSVSEQSHGMYTVMGPDGSHQAMLDAMMWSQRT